MSKCVHHVPFHEHCEKCFAIIAARTPALPAKRPEPEFPHVELIWKKQQHAEIGYLGNVSIATIHLHEILNVNEPYHVTGVIAPVTYKSKRFSTIEDAKDYANLAINQWLKQAGLIQR